MSSRLRSRALLGRVARSSSFEVLEGRRLLCATGSDLINAGIPADVIQDDGHILRSDYEKLSPELQAHVDPHYVGEERTEAPDWDRELGIPLYNSREDYLAALARSPDAPVEALPDFFPTMLSTNLDQTTQPGRNLFRFGTQVNNQGAGPAVLISGNPGNPIPTGAPITSWINPDGSQNVLQAVYGWDSATQSFTSSPLYYRAGGRFTWHPGHNHWHFDGYANYKLRHRNGDGTPGDYVMRGDGTEVVGVKTGFCLLTFSGTFTTESGQSSSQLPGFNKDNSIVSGCDLKQGIRVGRYDQYTSGLEGQWVDVTGVPNGQYFLEIKMDGEDAISETNEANNAKTFAVTINANPPVGGITPDQYDATAPGNDEFASSTDMGEMGAYAQTGLNIHWGQDQDYFKFTAASSGNGTVTATPANGNTELYLYDANHVQIGQSTNPSGPDSITYNFVQGQTYFAEVKSYNSTTSSNYQIAWNIRPTVTNNVGVAVASELSAAQPATFMIARNGPVTVPLNVTIQLGGTAVNGVDYELVSTNVPFGDLQSVREIQIIPISDGVAEPTETVTLTIASNNAYVIGGTAGGEVSISDTPPAVNASVFQYLTGPQRIQFDFNVDVSASLGLSDLTVTNLGTLQTVPADSVDYGLNRNRGTFTFNNALPDGNYRAVLSAAGVTHAFGLAMQSDVTVDFFVLAGDANHDRSIDIADFSALAGNFGLPGDFAHGDFNYDASVDIADFAILASKFNTTLAAARPASGIPANPAAGTGVLFGVKAIDAAIRQTDLVDDSGLI